MQLSELALTSQLVSQTTKRGQKAALIADTLKRTAGAEAPLRNEHERQRDVALSVAYLSGQVLQAKLGVSYAMVGTLASLPAVERSALTLRAVDDVLSKVEMQRGSGSIKRKQELLSSVYRAATSAEQHFLSALLTGELRQGALEGVLLDAVAQASNCPAEVLRRALLIRGNFVDVASTALLLGGSGLSAIRLRLFQPLAPMLAQPADEVAEALVDQRMQAEHKLDGARIQVHKQGFEIRVYSRQLNDVTLAVPEVVDCVARLPAEQLILDGEALAMNARGMPFPFQDTMRRFGRKTSPTAELLERLPIACFFFDCLHVDGEDVFDEPYHQRQARLDRLTLEHRVTRAGVTTPSDVQVMFESALSAGHEGVVLKNMDSGYEPGRRGTTWLKLKPVHTLDLVVLAAEWGSGRRKGTLSNLHLGARGPTGFVMLGKTFKGLTDAMLAFQTTELLARETHRTGNCVYVRPELVVEVAFDGVQRSPQYEGGVALRFARVKRYRPDKAPEQADTIEQVLAIATS